MEFPGSAPASDRRSRRPTVLIVEDEASLLTILSSLLDRHARVLTATNAERALEILGRNRVDVGFFDIGLGQGMDGISLIEPAKRLHPDLEVIICSVDRSVSTVVRAVRAGAFDYTTKEFDSLGNAHVLLERALERQRERRELTRLRAEAAKGEGTFVGSDEEPMRSVLATVDSAAESRSTVLILGESGTGKELIARRIHRRSPRAAEPFVAINVAAVPKGLLESGLFGHEKGAFTGAASRQLGRFEEADGGTLFLDEVGELEKGLQVKLLRAIQERVIDRVGGGAPVEIDVRIIAATNRNLEAAVKKGKFREDLYYRLNVVPIRLPPLRERVGDLPALVEALAKKHAAVVGRPAFSFTPAAVGALAAYQWPGNIRELENVIERMAVLVKDPVVEVADLPAEYRIGEFAEAAAKDGTLGGLDAALEAFERSMLTRAMREHDDNQAQAARSLGVALSTFRYRLEKFGLL